MYYILGTSIALRRWADIPCAYIKQGVANVFPVSREEFELLQQCDGQTQMVESKTLTRFIEKKIVRAAQEKEELHPWQRLRSYHNVCYIAADWAITTRCNYNCRHCFAADESAKGQDMKWEDCVTVLEQLENCGFQEVYLTGGEPFLHRDFSKILLEIAKRRLFLRYICTNGSLVTKEKLEEIKNLGHRPMFKISFDGVGTHDWLRNHAGAQKQAIDAISLIKSMGFSVKVQLCLYKDNVAGLMETVLLMDSLGVDEMRIMRVSESDKWKNHHEDKGLTPQEYYEASLQFLADYHANRANFKNEINIYIWELGCYNKHGKGLQLEGNTRGFDRKDQLLCGQIRSVIFVDYEGSLMFCNPFSGGLHARNIHFGSLIEDDLATILGESEYQKITSYCLKDYWAHNESCRECPHKNVCSGGCRAMAYALTGDFLGKDMLHCMFHTEGYYARAKQM